MQVISNKECLLTHIEIWEFPDDLVVKNSHANGEFNLVKI